MSLLISPKSSLDRAVTDRLMLLSLLHLCLTSCAIQSDGMQDNTIGVEIVLPDSVPLLGLDRLTEAEKQTLRRASCQNNEGVS